MNKKFAATIIAGLSAIVILGTGITAMAGSSWGQHMGSRGHHMAYDDEQWMGRGTHPMGSGHMYGNAYGREMSKEDFEKFDQERRVFYEATEGIRRDIYAKGLDLKRELVRDEPDLQRALDMQKIISTLQSQLDQKQLEWEIKARKFIPYYGRGPRGYSDHMMGGYHHRGGYCGQ